MKKVFVVSLLFAATTVTQAFAFNISECVQNSLENGTGGGIEETRSFVDMAKEYKVGSENTVHLGFVNDIMAGGLERAIASGQGLRFDLQEDFYPFSWQTKTFVYSQGKNAVSKKSPVPEPATLLLFGSGMIGLIGVKYRRKKVNI